MGTAYLLAHDLGTTGNKATLFDTQGRLIASALETYPTYYDKPGWVEQDPESWWQAVCRASGTVMQKAGITKSDVAAISFSGHMMGCVPVDASGHPLRRAIIWADQRATAQVKKLLETLSAEEIYRITGTRPNSNYTLEKIMWIRDNEPDVYRKTKVVLQSKDYIVSRLTGTFVTDYSDASATNAFDLSEKVWSDALLHAADIPASLFPEAVPSATVVGPVRSAHGVDLAGVPVVLGGGDGACATVGAGVIRANEGYNYFGSSSWIAIASDRPVIDPGMRTFNLCHLAPDLYMPVGTMQSAGGSYDWIRGVLFPEEMGKSTDEAYALLNRWAAASPPCAGGVLFLPYLIGERSPHWNEDARGAFVGLARSHGVGELVRAVIEGVAFNLHVIFDALTEQGTILKSLRMIGGGIRNAVLCQALADMLGIPIQRVESGEFATSLGAAVCAGVGVGAFEDFSVAAKLSPIAGTDEPLPERKAAYDRTYELFNRTYRSLEPLCSDLAALQRELMS